MSFVLSLIGAAAKSPLTQDDLEAAKAVLSISGLSAGEPVWLSPGEACEFAFAGSPNSVRDGVRAALAGRPIDVNVLGSQFRRKRLLLADMDSTLIQQECIDELAAKMGRGDEVAAITERAMRGEIAFAPALRERVRLLQGLPIGTVAKVLAERILLMPGASTLVATMRKFGAHTALVSGGFTVFANAIAATLGINEVRANTLLEADGAFTGVVAEPILGREAKADMLHELCQRFELTRDHTMAVGDGANDAEMVRLAGLGVAFHAKPALRAVASAVVDHADLTALLFLQGYRRDTFVSAPANSWFEASAAS